MTAKEHALNDNASVWVNRTRIKQDREIGRQRGKMPGWFGKLLSMSKSSSTIRAWNNSRWTIFWAYMSEQLSAELGAPDYELPCASRCALGRAYP